MRFLWTVTALLGLFAFAGSAQAQLRPSDEPPELPEFPPEERERSLLPPVPMPPEEERGRLSTGRRMVVTRFEVQGSTVFTDEELAKITAPYEGREIGVADFGRVRNAITSRYVDAGYITSGAVIPDQKVVDGVVVIEVIEGTLDKVVVQGNEQLLSGYIEGRIERGIGTPVNVYELEEQLQMLQQKDLIRSVNAQLDPTARRGESTLTVLVHEERPTRASIGSANDQSPTVGSEGGKIRLRHLSLTKNGDILTGRGNLTEGYSDMDFHYSIPLNAHDTTLLLNYRRTRGEVVESPFDDLDIDSTASTYAIGVRHPLIQRLDQELWLGLTGEYRESETDWFFGDFPFTPGSDDGEIEIAVLRFLQEWTQRSPNRVIAARSTLNFGLDALGSTTNSGSTPDSKFVAWLLQLQLAHRLPERYRGAQIVARADLQLTNDPLLSLEQYALGGMNTVRGYRENELVRDNGYSTSIELRIPVLRSLLERGQLEVAPFFDIGRAWDEHDRSGPETLSSLGLGLRYQLQDRMQAQVYWGGRLRHVKRRGNDIQNNGWHFNVEMALW